MLSGQNATGLQTDPHDLLSGLTRPAGLLCIGAVKEDCRMQVAVPGVEDVRNAKIVALRHLCNARQDLRQATAWNDRIVADVVRRHASKSPECFLASFPELLAILLGLGKLNVGHAAGGQHLFDHTYLRIDRFPQPINFSH